MLSLLVRAIHQINEIKEEIQEYTYRSLQKNSFCVQLEKLVFQQSDCMR
jgi:hypothetical protein